MKKILIIAIIILLKSTGHAQDDYQKGESPYFIIRGGENSMPLLDTRADVNIAATIADVKITQVYTNKGKKPIEAIYVFPASTGAAIHGLTMTINERVVKAKISKKEDARKTYEKAKSEGKRASLLEQKRPNVFKMNIANIMPADTIIVELEYTEKLLPDDGLFEFMLPTVVGPRFKPKSPEGEDDFPDIKYHYGESSYDFDININLMSGVPVHEMECPTHKLDMTQHSDRHLELSLAENQEKTGNRDFVLRYRLTGGHIESGLLLSEGEVENFFMLTLQPPARVGDAEIIPREYIFVMDVSYSMAGDPIEISKELMFDLLDRLGPNDMFNIQYFASTSYMMSETSLPVTPENIEFAKKDISENYGGGGTNLYHALTKSLAIDKKTGYARSYIIVTDGYILVDEKVVDLIRENLNNANFFAFGIGSSVNRYLIEAIAKCGYGEPFVVLDMSEAEDIAVKFSKYIEDPVLSDIEIDFDGLDVYDVEPENIPDVFGTRPINIVGKWRGIPEGEIEVSGQSSKGKLKVSIPLKVFVKKDTSQALKYLWARDRIEELELLKKGQIAYTEKEITDLGLKYGLMTEYTSFVAVDNQIANKKGNPTVVEQDLPLPENVSFGRTSYASSYSGGYSGYGGGDDAVDNPLMPIAYRKPIYVGPVFGVHRTFMSIESDYDENILNSFKAENLSGNGWNIGLSFEYLLGNIKNSNSSIIGIVKYESMNGKDYHNINPEDLVLNMPQISELPEYERIVDLQLLDITLLYKYNMFNSNFGIAAGPSFSLILGTNDYRAINLFDENISFPNVDGYKLDNNGQTLILRDGDVPDVNAFRIALNFRLQYEILLGRMYIVPYAGYQLGLTSLSPAIKLNMIHIGTEIRFAI